MTRTAISPRFAIRSFLNIAMSKWALLPEPLTILAGKNKPLRREGADCVPRFRNLLLLVHGDALRSGLLLCLRLLRSHCLIHPLVSSFQVSGALFRLVAFPVCLLAVKQVHIRHGVVVILPHLQGLGETVNAILN